MWTGYIFADSGGLKIKIRNTGTRFISADSNGGLKKTKTTSPQNGKYGVGLC
jgi:hypothetical protein